MSRKTNLTRILSAAIAVLICVPMLSAFPAAAEDSPPAADTADAANASSANELFTKQKTYSDYYDEIKDVPRPNAEALLTYSGKDDVAEAEVTSFEGKDNVLVWSNEEGRVDFTVDIPQAGAYQLEMSYYPLDGGATTTEVSVLSTRNSPAIR